MKKNDLKITKGKKDRIKDDESETRESFFPGRETLLNAQRISCWKIEKEAAVIGLELLLSEGKKMRTSQKGNHLKII